jgi:hypothetical protein
MRPLDQEMPIASVWGQPRTGFSRHVFRGGNFFMPRMLNSHRAELGVEALPQELSAASARTVQHLQSEAAALSAERAAVRNGKLRAEVRIENLAGHKLPSAYPSRRVWLHFTVRDGNGDPIFESGGFGKNGSIAGNDNDADPTTYEPHYTEITSTDEVQIYETILFGSDGGVTTGLLTAVAYGKDNRILPLGFDKATAGEDIAVQGRAATDSDFAGGGDRIVYSIDVAGARGPFQVEAELWYQPIGFRWAQNLSPYDTHETNRFVSYYETLSEFSGIVLTRTTTTVP